VKFVGIAAYGDLSFVGNDFYIRFYEDDGGIPGSMVQEEVVTVTSEVDTGLLLFSSYPILEATVSVTPITLENGWFSVQMIDSWEQLAVAPSTDDDLHIFQYQYGAPYGEFTNQDMAFAVNVVGGKTGDGKANCTFVLDTDFENTSDWGNPGSGFQPYPGWSSSHPSNYFWIDGSLFGQDAHSGTKAAYSYTASDSMITPAVTLADGTSTLTFWYRAEAFDAEQSLAVYADGDLVWQHVDFTHEDWVQATINLGAYALQTITVEFVNIGDPDFDGMLVDDVQIETCEIPEFEGDAIWFDMVYQMDLAPQANVYLEVYGSEDNSGPWCDSCDDTDCVCPPGENAWTKVATFNGHMPGECLYYKVDLAPFLDVNDTVMCLRLRLDTEYYGGVDPWTGNPLYTHAGPGIGMHIHEYTIENLTYDELTTETVDYFQDFEDGMMEHTPGCIVFGEYWEQDVEDHSLFCQTWPAEPVDNALVWSTTIDNAYYATLFAYRTMSIDEGTTVSLELSADGGDSWYIISKEEGPIDESGIPTLVLTDDYGDGWTAGGIWATMDVYVNGVLDLSGVTCTGATASYTVNALPGDEVTVCYTGGLPYWEGEHSWQLIVGSTVLLQDGQGGAIPATGCKDTAIPDFGMPMFPCTPFDLTPWAGQDILIRVHVVDEEGEGGEICVGDFLIMGKIDTEAPTTTISLSGSVVGPNTYAGTVTATITATDDTGMGTIYYTVDGVEKSQAGDKATFQVTGDGTHTITYWGVDAAGNIGPTGSVSFFIDATAPTVAITAPEPGLYLFGRKLLSMSKPIIIGAFTAEATASDAQGVSHVAFYLGDTLVGADTAAPYSILIAQKNMGATTLKVVAVDGVGNSAQDSMDITYFKFL